MFYLKLKLIIIIILSYLHIYTPPEKSKAKADRKNIYKYIFVIMYNGFFSSMYYGQLFIYFNKNLNLIA